MDATCAEMNKPWNLFVYRNAYDYAEDQGAEMVEWFKALGRNLTDPAERYAWSYGFAPGYQGFEQVVEMYRRSERFGT